MKYRVWKTDELSISSAWFSHPRIGNTLKCNVIEHWFDTQFVKVVPSKYMADRVISPMLRAWPSQQFALYTQAHAHRNIAYSATNYSGKYGWIGIIWILTEKIFMHTHTTHIDMAMYVSQQWLNIASWYSASCVLKWLYRPSACLKILQPIIYPSFSAVLVTICIFSKQL